MSTAASSGEVREIQLIQKAARGDGDAFALLFEKHFETIYNYVLWLCNDPDQAEDLTQETFIRAHRSLSNLGPPWAIRPWLYRLAHNLFIDFVRQKKPVHPLDPDAPFPSSEFDPERQLLFEELSGPVAGALVRLSPNYREALVLREIQGFQYAEIAEIMGVSVDHVKVLLHRARASFKDNYGLRLLVEKPTAPCSVLNELLDAFEDKEHLTPEQEALVREHIKDCPSCSQRKREIAALLLLFRGLPVFKLPDTLRSSLLQPAGKGGQAAAQSGPNWNKIKNLFVAAVLAAGLALAAWLFFNIIKLPPPGGPVSAPPLSSPSPVGGVPFSHNGTITPATPSGVCVCGDGVCNPSCENTDLCSQDCTCNMNGVCDPGEGFNCPDCAPTSVSGGGSGGKNNSGGGGGTCGCTCLNPPTCSRWRNDCTGAAGSRTVCR